MHLIYLESFLGIIVREYVKSKNVIVWGSIHGISVLYQMYLKLRVSHQIIESFWLEETVNIIKSNY